jgi:hypothetical protein
MRRHSTQIENIPLFVAVMHPATKVIKDALIRRGDPEAVANGRYRAHRSSDSRWPYKEDAGADCSPTSVQQGEPVIIQWKRVSATEQLARWQGKNLLLMYNPATGRWHIQVDAQWVRQDWATPRAAQLAVENILQRVVLAASAGAQAAQRTSSETRIVRGGQHAQSL